MCKKETKLNLRTVVVILVFLLVVAVCTSSVFATGIYEGGDGSEGNPFQINTPVQMNEIGQHSEDWGSYFILTADIDLSGYTGTSFNIIGIGDPCTSFTGSFDGNGHTISNFTYTTTGTHFIGLFGWAGSGGEIKDLGLTNVNVNAGTGWYVGGMVGYNNNGTVSNCYATGTVTGDSRVGGLVGWNDGTVSNCYATGSVTGTGDYDVGGLVGCNELATVSNCYATGNVTGTGSYVGGLVGYNLNADIFASFWDTQTAGQGSGVGLIGGTGTVEVYGRTTAEMQTQTTFTDYGWDFIGETANGTEDIWVMLSGYPKLTWELELPSYPGSGTAFTYQGRLYDANSPAEGLYDFEFEVYDDDDAGNQQGATINQDEVDVIDGYFTVQLDFGSDPNVFNGYARWLQIAVRPGESSDPCDFVTLSPRQELTPTPYSIYAKTTGYAETAGGVPNGISGSGTANYIPKFTNADTLSDSVIYENAGNVGIGTTSPATQLDVDGTITASGGNSGNWNTAYSWGDHTGAGYLTSETDPQVGANTTNYVPKWDGSSLITGTIYDNGNVGIGTSSPDAKLTVNGAILRDGSTMYGIHAYSHINLGTSSTTGESGQNHTYASVGGGKNNTASYSHATVGGGKDNTASGTFATVGGGYQNIASSEYSTVGGGSDNTASHYFATVGGGLDNTASGWCSFAAGGAYNVAGGDYSFAAGRRAKANHDGAFVWADSTYADFASTGANQFLICASGGVGIGRAPAANDLEVEGTASKTTSGNWLANSDLRIKADIETVSDALETLDKVRLVSFKYTDDYQAKHPSIDHRRYLNVVAQEFAEVFPDYVKSSKEKLPNGDEILQVDAYPLTVYSAAAVQELHAIVKAKDARLAAQDAEIAAMKERLAIMEASVSKLINSNDGGRL